MPYSNKEDLYKAQKEYRQRKNLEIKVTEEAIASFNTLLMIRNANRAEIKELKSQIKRIDSFVEDLLTTHFSTSTTEEKAAIDKLLAEYFPIEVLEKVKTQVNERGDKTK